MSTVEQNIEEVERLCRFGQLAADNMLSYPEVLEIMIGVTAAKEGEVGRDGQVRPKPKLQVGDVYGSRTGIPAAADALIGWGCSDALKQQEMACLSIVKNKLVDGNTTADGKYSKYGTFHVKVNPETGVVYNSEGTQ